jgi:hypothetical protein
MPRKKTTKPRKAGPKRTGATTKVRGGFPCPDCDFVAKHAMGLGRHRSTRHGAVSKRASRMTRPAAVVDGNWLSRQDAAARAGVHYNTIRQWEQQGLLGTTKRGGRRGSLLSAQDLDRFMAERRGSVAVAGAAPASAPSASMSRVVEQFARSLEALLTELRATQTTVAVPRKRGRPLGSKNKPKVEAAAAPKRRGRPPGSKNKPKVEAAAAPKRRGRPPGSKNKKPRATASARKPAARKPAGRKRRASR